MRTPRPYWLSAVLLSAWLGSCSSARQTLIQVEVQAGAVARVQTPITVALELDEELGKELGPRSLAGAQPRVHCPGLAAVQAQVARDAQAQPKSLLLSWVEDNLAPQESRSYRFQFETSGGGSSDEGVYATKDGEGFRELLLAGRPLHRHVTIFDQGQFEQTYKAFLHVYGPTSAELITKGPGGTYSHHRGIFLGWNKVRYGEEGQKELTDFWHCKQGASIRHRHFLPSRSRSGPVYHDCATENQWIDGKGRIVLQELRQLRTWRQPPGRMLLDFKISLEALAGEVVLDGDAHHAGFHFRAVEEIAQHREETHYLRPGTARSKGNDIWIDCPWVVCRFKTGGRSYTVMYMDHHQNPKPVEMSTRPYARFGAFSRHHLKPGLALQLSYRILIVDETESTPLEEEVYRRYYQDYTHPPLARQAPRPPR